MLACFTICKKNVRQLISNLKQKISSQKMASFPIHQYDIGQRLDRYLKKSPIGWINGQKCLRKKDIVIRKADGTIMNQKNYKLQKGDILLISSILRNKLANNQLNQDRLVSFQESDSILSKMIIFDNENMSILNKKNGYSVQGGINPKFNLYSLMCSKYKKQLIHITHRLDKGTSGLVIFAKNKQTAQLIQTSMEQRNCFSKFYIAQSEGAQPVLKPGYIRCNIQWGNQNKARLCNQTEQASKDCTTYYMPIMSEKLENQKYRNLLGIKLVTGRKHQIRCHLSQYLQQPIINDLKYGQTNLKNVQINQGIFLHAFGMFIKKKQIINKLITGKSQIINKQLGNMIINQQQNNVLFTAVLPQFWTFSEKDNLNLQFLATLIQSKEKNNQKEKPNQRNMSLII